MNDLFQYTLYIDSTPEKVWEALTGSEFTRQYWSGRSIESDWRPGSPVRTVKDDGGIDWSGQILAADPPRLLSYTFELQSPPSGAAAEPPSRVTFEISTVMDKVKLTITHDQFPVGSKVLPGISNGWPTLLSGLKSLLETGKPLFGKFCGKPA